MAAAPATRIVFRPFDGTPDGVLAAGDDALHLFGRNAESRRTFRGVQELPAVRWCPRRRRKAAAAAKGGHDHSNGALDRAARSRRSKHGLLDSSSIISATAPDKDIRSSLRERGLRCSVGRERSETGTKADGSKSLSRPPVRRPRQNVPAPIPARPRRFPAATASTVAPGQACNRRARTRAAKAGLSQQNASRQNKPHRRACLGQFARAIDRRPWPATSAAAPEFPPAILSPSCARPRKPAPPGWRFPIWRQSSAQSIKSSGSLSMQSTGKFARPICGQRPSRSR